MILLGAAGYELFQAQAGSDEVQTSYQAYQAATEDVEARWRAVERSVDDQRQAATLSGVLLGGALLTLSFGLYQLTRDAEAPRPKADRGGIRWEVSF